MSRSRSATGTSQISYSSASEPQPTTAPIDWNWKDIRGTALKPVKLDANMNLLKKDELSSDRFSKLNVVLNKIENKSQKIRSHYSLVKELDETLSWCDEFIEKTNS